MPLSGGKGSRRENSQRAGRGERENDPFHSRSPFVGATIAPGRL
jgi:hypothetical protein